MLQLSINRLLVSEIICRLPSTSDILKIASVPRGIKSYHKEFYVSLVIFLPIVNKSSVIIV